MRARRWLGSGRAARGVALGCLTVLGAAVALAQPLAAPLMGISAAATSTVPYADPDAVGSIGLCNQAGQQITTGSITTRPFAWRAVSTQAAPAPYNNAGRTATLVAYQPQQALPAGDWSGTQMTASSSYTNPANPMAAATDGDQSLQSIIEEYPPRWDGFIELRMYLGTANQEPYESQYPALNIQVTGDTWQAIGGSPVNCASGTAQSIESVLLPSSTTTTTPTKAQPTTPPTTAVSGQGTSGAGVPSGTDTGAAGSKGVARDSAVASGTTAVADPAPSSNFPLILGIGLPVLVLLAAWAYLLRRRRLASHPTGPEPHSQSSSPTKGDAK